MNILVRWPLSVRPKRPISPKSVSTSLAILSAATMASAQGGGTHDSPVVMTTSGPVRGITREGVQIVKGVPYGADTGGTHRFLPPRPPVRSKAILDGTKYGPICPQPKPSATTIRVIAPMFAPPLRTAPPVQSENCLVLNIWGTGANAGRPVLVWIHGGGFTSGSGTSADGGITDGQRLAEKYGLVVVTLNHRLGALGYTYLREAGGEKFASSGNAGTQDIVLALRWVRGNIRSFGGDPGRVTVMGESGGGQKVSVLLASPAAKGLFHRAVIMSGPGLRMADPTAASSLAQSLLKEAGVGGRDVAALQKLPVDQIIAAQERVVSSGADAAALTRRLTTERAGLAPVVDNLTLSSHPFHPRGSGVSRDVPLIIGATKDETALFLRGDSRFGKFERSDLEQRFGNDLGPALWTLVDNYGDENRPLDSTQAILRITSDHMMARSLLLADRKAASGKAPVYVVKFAYNTNAMDGRLGAPHGIDVPFTFAMVSDIPVAGTMSSRFDVADRWASTIAAFAATGDPTNAKIPRWPRHKPGQNVALWVDERFAVRPALTPEAYKILRPLAQ